MDRIDFTDGREIPPFLPVNPTIAHGDDLLRCRRCAAVLVVIHLRCDDGALLPIYRCPICRHAGAGETMPRTSI